MLMFGLASQLKMDNFGLISRMQLVQLYTEYQLVKVQ
jgi:hypothetical protein